MDELTEQLNAELAEAMVRITALKDIVLTLKEKDRD